MSVIRFSLISACLGMGFMASLQAAELPTFESSVTALNNQLQQQSPYAISSKMGDSPPAISPPNRQCI